MKISRPVNNNFYEEKPILQSGLTDAFSVKKSAEKKVIDLFSSVYELKLGNDQLKQTAIKVVDFRTRRFAPDKERLVLKLYSKEIDNVKNYFIQTGLYAGVLYHKGCKFNITTKYGDAFLKRMLNFVNDIYIDTKQAPAKKEEIKNQFLFIIAHLFIQKLEKTSVLGIPQEYIKQHERSHKVRGAVDFNAYLKQDIPFQGKLTSTFKERCYIQEIVDVLYLTLKKLESIFGKEIHSRLLGILQLLKQHYSGRYVTAETIRKAQMHPAINNPIYNGFKKVLEYAEIILMNNDLINDEQHNKLQTSGHLFDIAELFEIYLEKLLSRNFDEWQVSSQEEAQIYNGKFYNGYMYPDIVMRHKESNKIVVFDAKFKNMRTIYKDLDRTDLYQIHSYIGYYNPLVIAGGLLYPLSNEFNIDRCYSNNLFGNRNNEIKFIVDGIYLKEDMTTEQIINSEENFITRLKNSIQ